MNKRWLCLDEDAEAGGTGTRCDQQCGECKGVEEHEGSDYPPSDGEQGEESGK